MNNSVSICGGAQMGSSKRSSLNGVDSKASAFRLASYHLFEQVAVVGYAALNSFRFWYSCLDMRCDIGGHNSHPSSGVDIKRRSSYLGHGLFLHGFKQFDEEFIAIDRHDTFLSSVLDHSTSIYSTINCRDCQGAR